MLEPELEAKWEIPKEMQFQLLIQRTENSVSSSVTGKLKHREKENIYWGLIQTRQNYSTTQKSRLLIARLLAPKYMVPMNF